MTAAIDVRECVEDPQSWYSVKRFRIGGVAFERPLKMLEAGPAALGGWGGNGAGGAAVAEAGMSVESPGEIRALQDDAAAGGGRLDALLCPRGRPAGMPGVVSITLGFNPTMHAGRGAGGWGVFFDACRRHSTLFLAVPNVRTSRPDGDGQLRPIMGVGEYARFVDSAFDMLDAGDGRPVFVPLPMRLPLADISALVDGYVARDRLCIWADFEGRAVGEATLARIAHAMRRLRDSGRLARSVLYFANVRREMPSNGAAGRAPASDALAPLAGASIVGAGREPPGGGRGAGRLFDPASYYYAEDKGGEAAGGARSAALNEARLDCEFAEQSEALLREGSVVPLMRTKEMLAEYRKGDILRALAEGGPEPSLSDYL